MPASSNTTTSSLSVQTSTANASTTSSVAHQTSAYPFLTIAQLGIQDSQSNLESYNKLSIDEQNSTKGAEYLVDAQKSLLMVFNAVNRNMMIFGDTCSTRQERRAKQGLPDDTSLFTMFDGPATE
jgi:hypothetical protein